MKHPVRFGDWVWDPNTLELRNGSRVVTLEPRVARLLEYMLDHPGELLTQDILVRAVWDGRIISNEAVRQAVFSLRQAMAAGDCAGYIRTIHKRGYIAQFPPCIVESGEHLTSQAAPFANVYPRTPEPPGTLQAPPRASTTQIAIARWLLSLGLAVVTVLAVVLLTRLDVSTDHQAASTQNEVTSTGIATIAVLPFINLSPASESDVLAEGLAEELLGTLARNPELRVTARPSAFQFRGADRNLRDVGRQLGVRYVVDGSVRNLGGRVRIHTRLVDAGTGKQLWSDKRERSLEDWYDLQQVVAAQVAHALKEVLRWQNKPLARIGGTANVEAHLEVLRARQLLATRKVADAEQAIEHLQRALLLDPNYALAYARLADAILIQAESTSGIKAARHVVEPLLAKALALDPGFGEAYCLRSRLTDDVEAAERDLRRGLDLNPSYARGYELLAELQSNSAKQFDLAVETIDSAIALDPLTPGYYHAKAMLMMRRGDWEAAAELDRRALELNPNFGAALVQLAQVVSVQGDFAEAIGYNRRAVALDPRALPPRDQLITLYVAVGDIEAARAANVPPTALGSWAIPWVEGKESQLADMLYSRQSGPVQTMDPMISSQILLRQAVSDGNYARALALLAPLVPTGDFLTPDASGWALYAYANLVQLLALSGDKAGAIRLQMQLEDRMSANERRFPRHALVHAQLRSTLLARAGRSEEACAALEQAYTPKPRPFWRVILANPAFDDMSATPCFQTLRTRIESYVAAERERVDASSLSTLQVPDL